jgi:hypothetical protein
MAYLLSPQVHVVEIDTTNIVPGVATTEGAIAGQFNWGPVNEPMLIDSEATLIRTFGYPDNTNYCDWFSASNFLAYTNALWVVRAVTEGNANTTLNATNATTSNSHGYLVRNDQEYAIKYSNGELKTEFFTGDWVARFPGDLGNSLKISICPSASAYQSTLAGTISATANSSTVTGSGTTFQSQIISGDLLEFNGELHKVVSVESNTSLTLADRTLQAATSVSNVIRRWEYYSSVQTAPGTSDYATQYGGSNDEMHIVVIDVLGEWTQQPGAVLEVYQYVSQASDALLRDGTNNYYPNQVNSRSQYVRWAGHPGQFTNAGKPAKGVNFVPTPAAKPITEFFQGGNDGEAIGAAEKIRGYGYFLSPEDIDISFIIGSNVTQTVATYIINDIAEARMDCVAFISPPAAYVINNVGEEAQACVNYRNLLPSSSYAAIDGNWKYQYDQYNDVYRYVPLNGDIAGLHAQSDQQRDPWWAAAGFNRGQIKNVIKLAWNPKLAERNLLYNNGINPVVTFPGDGTVLFGQKTMLAKPSAFDRINVRRLFIVLEKAISKAGKYFLFEFNDAITRAQFKNMIDPYMRDVQGRRGVYDFLTICDETNNTPEVIDGNQFVASILIKPEKTAEFITLNFVAVRDSVAFTEVQF